MKYVFLLLFVAFNVSAQTKNGNLLLLRVEKENNLTIDKYQHRLFVIELDSMNIPLKDSGMMPVLINDFSDAQLEACKNGKTFEISDVYTSGSFNSVNSYGGDNYEKVTANFKKMRFLANIKVKDISYSKKIKISYTLINGSYCVGELITKNEIDFYNDKKIVILSSPITIDNSYKIPKQYSYEVLKSVNFNYFMVDFSFL